MDGQTMNAPHQLPQLTEPSTPTTPTGHDALTLKKALEWELSLDKCDLRSHGWYYGSVSRQYAEELLKRDEDFLVRDCVSQPGNYVLTCMAKGAILHFVINKVLLQADTVYEKIQYQFEDDAYDTVPDLITYYVGSGKCISMASGARVRYPCNRNYPLSFYMAKYHGGPVNANGMVGSRGVSPLNSPSFIKMDFSPRSSPPLHVLRDMPPKFPVKKQRSQSLTPIQPGKPMTACSVQRIRGDKYCSGDGVVLPRNGPFARYASLDEECSRADHPPHLAKENSTNSLNRLHAAMVLDSVAAFKHSTQSLPRTTTNGDFQAAEPMRAGSLTRAGAAALQAKAIASRELPLDIRPQVNRFVTYHASGSDSGNGSGDSVQSPAASEMDAVPHAQQRGVVIRPPHFLAHSLSSMTLKSLADVDYAELERSVLAMERPDIEPPATRFDVDNFATLLLPSVENQPLDKDALTTVRMILGETAPRLIANCLSRIDAQLMLDERRAAGDADNGTRAAEVRGCSGIELMTLPHGRQFRVDLVERTECIRLMVAVTILTCADDGERAETLDRWIQIANDTKTALGNLYGFSNIMIGLCMPQIEKLQSTWYILRQKFTDSAFNFEAKLRPQWKNMNNCTNPLAPNTTIPHILPYILLRDRAITDIFDPNETETASHLFTSCISQWEMNTPDFGLSISYAHLDLIRSFNNNLAMYRRNAQIMLSDSCGDRIDELLFDAFRTEFHMKFLWGSKGALIEPSERYTKFDNILTLMSQRYCSDANQNGNDNAKPA